MNLPAAPLQLDIFAPTYAVEELISARARHIRIEVRAADRIRLVIPRHASRTAARAFLESRRDWIEEKLAELRRRAENLPLDSGPMRWDGRDRLPLRGVDHEVRIVVASLRAPMVRVEPGVLTLFASTATLALPRILRATLMRALRHEAERDARPLIAQEASRLGVNPLRLRLSDPRSLWGSCSVDGAIQLSWRLVMAPPEVLRYVVIHELCHLVHHDHSDAFWALVALQCPDYRQPYEWLRHHGARLHQVLSG
jgi:predicted metal-dependent hydrolase